MAIMCTRHRCDPARPGGQANRGAVVRALGAEPAVGGRSRTVRSRFRFGVAGGAPTRHPVWVAAFLDHDRSPRNIWIFVLLHVVGFAVGLVLAWVVVGELWVRFDSIVPMWVGATVVASAAVALIAWRRARFAGIGAGLVLSALLACAIFTLLSSGPALD